MTEIIAYVNLALLVMVFASLCWIIFSKKLKVKTESNGIDSVGPSILYEILKIRNYIDSSKANEKKTKVQSGKLLAQASDLLNAINKK